MPHERGEFVAAAFQSLLFEIAKQAPRCLKAHRQESIIPMRNTAQNTRRGIVCEPDAGTLAGSYETAQCVQRSAGQSQSLNTHRKTAIMQNHAGVNQPITTATAVRNERKQYPMKTEITIPTIADIEAASEIAALKEELAQLKADRDAERRVNEETLASLALERAASAAKERSKPLNNGQAEIARSRAIDAVGGLAKFNLLSDAQRAEALGIHDSDQIKTSELEKFFGRKSSSQAAASLAKTNPGRYRLYRQLARVRGVF